MGARGRGLAPILDHQDPILAAGLPAFSDDRAGRGFAIAVARIKSSRARICVMYDQAQPRAARGPADLLGDAQQGRAMPLSTVFRQGGQHIDVPTVQRRVLTLLQRLDNGGSVSTVSACTIS